MALKKSQLYASLWQSCDELRGGMDASLYKDYVLTLLFMKYVSDKYAGKPGALIVVPDGGGFGDMVALKGDKEIGDKINKIISRLAEANDLKGVIDQADFNDEGKLGTGKEMQDRLSKLVAIFDGLDFRANRAEGDDLLGDAYEYLMRHFATESGKSKGQFYTPAEVSRIMAQVIGIDRAAGKIRLPGFSREWGSIRLGDHVTFLRHGVNSRAELTVDGPVKYLHYGDIHTTAGEYLDPDRRQMPSLPAERARTLDRLKQGDLVLVDASEDLDGIGKSVELRLHHGHEVVSGLHTIAARFDKTVLADGFKAYLQFCPAFREHLRRLAAGTKVFATNREHIATLEMQLPRCDEQIAISSVLSDMATEIAALETRRDKTRDIKQGMLQQLLTGRVRLVKPTPEKTAA